jgi:hypothetical protein
MPNVLKLLACSVFLALGSGCATHHLVDVLPIGGRQELRRGSLDLEIRNPSGSVSVTVSPGADPLVRIRPVHAAPGRRSAPVDLGKAAFSRTPQGSKLSVKTNGSAGPIHIEVTVPECASLSIHNSNGPVEVEGPLGSIDVRNDSTGEFAHVNIRTETDLVRPIAVHSAYGDVVIRGGEQSAGTISSHAPHGTTEVQTSQMRLRGVSYERALFSGVLNAGNEPWKFDVANGSVRLTFERFVEPLVK